MSGTNEPDLTREPEFDPDFDPAEALEDAREAREAAEDEDGDAQAHQQGDDGDIIDE